MDRLNSITEQEWETFSQCAFERKQFRPYPALVLLDSDGCGIFSEPYRGQSYDKDKFSLIDNYWDHEHCDVCNKRIEEGDWYWTNRNEKHVDICEICINHVRDEIDRRRSEKKGPA